MRSLAALSLLLLAAPAPEIQYFHFERPIEKPAQAAGQTCLVVDPEVFAHAAPQLADLRIYQGSTQTPFVVRADVPVVSTNQQIALLNLGRSGNRTVFDAGMPSGRYSDLELKVNGHDFLATVTVAGAQSEAAASRTQLGSFTIFDLTRQRLGRSTVLHLPESDFRYLHFQIAGPMGPDDVTGLSVTRMPASKPKFLTVAETGNIAGKNRNSVVEFTVPAHTPIDRVVFVPGQKPANFSRDVETSVAPLVRPKTDDETEAPQPVSYPGNILRVHSVEDGVRIDEEDLSVDTPRVDFDGAAKWTVTIENHDDAPIELTSVRLEMLERRLCFDAAAGAAYTLYYGDAALGAPQYDYASLFAPQADAVVAQLGAESVNAALQPRPDQRPFTEKHPILLWVALVVVIALLGVVAFSSFKAGPSKPSS
jgi:hypothetical protein